MTWQPRYSPQHVRRVLAGLHGGLAGQARLPVKSLAPVAKMPTVTAAAGTQAELDQLQALLKAQQAALNKIPGAKQAGARTTPALTAARKAIAETNAKIAKTQAELNTVYKDADGKVITKDEYNRLVALAQSGQQVTVYKDADGNVITEAQYNQLVAAYEAEQNAPQVTTKPVTPPKLNYCKTGQILVDGKCSFPAASTPLPKPQNTGIVPVTLGPAAPLPKAPVAATPETVKQVLQANAQGVAPVVVPKLPAVAPRLQVPAPVQVGIPASASSGASAAPVQVQTASPTSYSQAAADPAVTYTSSGPAAEAAPVAQTTVDVPVPTTPAPASTAKTVATVGLVAAIPLVMGFLGDK